MRICALGPRGPLAASAASVISGCKALSTANGSGGRRGSPPLAFLPSSLPNTFVLFWLSSRRESKLFWAAVFPVFDLAGRWIDWSREFVEWERAYCSCCARTHSHSLSLLFSSSGWLAGWQLLGIWLIQTVPIANFSSGAFFLSYFGEFHGLSRPSSAMMRWMASVWPSHALSLTLFPS